MPTSIGFTTYAINSKDVDYVKLAYLQALAVKTTQVYSDYAVIVRIGTKIPKKYRKVFDKVIELPEEICKNPVIAETHLMWASPFKETFKLEADCLPVMDLSHWLRVLRTKDTVFGLNCFRYDGVEVVDVANRQAFHENNLPNIYTGITYSRFSAGTSNLMMLAREIENNWNVISKKYNQLSNSSTDLVFSIAADLLSRENFTIPLSGFGFTHLKPSVQSISSDRVSTALNIEVHPEHTKINNVLQLKPVHYYEKELCTDSLIREYESHYARISRSIK